MKASCGLFSQILKLIPRTDFERLVKQTKAEHRSKGLSSWSQFAAMLFCQLGRAHSLRESEGGLKSCEGKLHLVLDHDGYLPCFGLVTDGKVTDGKVADVKAAWQITLAPGTTVVDDRGYNDYRLFADWTDSGVFCVTRIKDNA